MPPNGRKSAAKAAVEAEEVAPPPAKKSRKSKAAEVSVDVKAAEVGELAEAVETEVVEAITWMDLSKEEAAACGFDFEVRLSPSPLRRRRDSQQTSTAPCNRYACMMAAAPDHMERSGLLLAVLSPANDTTQLSSVPVDGANQVEIPSASAMDESIADDADAIQDDDGLSSVTVEAKKASEDEAREDHPYPLSSPEPGHVDGVSDIEGERLESPLGDLPLGSPSAMEDLPPESSAPQASPGQRVLAEKAITALIASFLQPDEDGPPPVEPLLSSMATPTPMLLTDDLPSLSVFSTEKDTIADTSTVPWHLAMVAEGDRDGHDATNSEDAFADDPNDGHKNDVDVFHHNPAKRADTDKDGACIKDADRDPAAHLSDELLQEAIANYAMVGGLDHKEAVEKFAVFTALVAKHPERCPRVIGQLLDLDAPGDMCQRLLQAVGALCPLKPLVEQAESREKLRLLLPWLEAREAEGVEDASLHDALAKLHIDLDRDPEEFLTTNAFYSSVVVGKYCEDYEHPQLAFIAYERARGFCDEQLIDVSNRNGLFRLQASYLLEQQNVRLWLKVLQEENLYLANILTELIRRASLTSATSAARVGEVAAAVEALQQVGLTRECEELLDKAVQNNPNCREDPGLCRKLGKVKMETGRTAQAIQAYLMAGYPEQSEYLSVVEAAESGGHFEELVNYLRRAHGKVDDPRLLERFMFALAKTSRFQELQEVAEKLGDAASQGLAVRLLQESAKKALQSAVESGDGGELQAAIRSGEAAGLDASELEAARAMLRLRYWVGFAAGAGTAAGIGMALVGPGTAAVPLAVAGTATFGLAAVPSLASARLRSRRAARAVRWRMAR